MSETPSEFETLKKTIREDLENNPRYAEFFGNFTELAKTSFIGHYSSEKAHFLIDGKESLNSFNELEEEIQDRAMEYLMLIKQKKLYDMQCLWRAEKLIIPGIEASCDFDEWAELISKNECPIDIPILESDVDLLCEFVSKYAHMCTNIYCTEWQEYPFDNRHEPNLDEEDLYSDHIYHWYSYYNEHTGTPDYDKLLPDIRSPKEDAYIKAYLDSKEKSPVIHEEKWHPDGIYSDSNTPIAEFIAEFEPPEFMLYREAYDRTYAVNDNWKYNQALRFMSMRYHHISINENKDWVEGVIEAANIAWKSEITSAIRSAWWICQNTMELNIKVEPHDNKDSFADYTKTIKELIVEGRKILGEPADFNF